MALEGEPCSAVFFVMQGRVRAYKMSVQGREQLVNEVGAGGWFYLVPALDGEPLPVTTEAATRATLLRFPRAEFLSLLACYPSVAMGALVEFARRLRRLSSLVEDLSLRSVAQRLGRLLIERAGSVGGHRMTQREMAAQLGTVREVVARNLSDLQRRGWIRVKRGVIEILDPEALRRFALVDEL